MNRDAVTDDGTAGDRAVDDQPADDQETPKHRWHLPRSTTVALATGILLGTALLLWGADWAARLGAQSALAGTIQSATGVADRPAVNVHGIFFLPQVVRGVYDDVEITVAGLNSGPLRVDRLHAELTGVHLSFHDVLVQSSTPVYIEHATEQATLRYSDLNTYFQATGRPFTISGAPDGEAPLTGSVTILGKEISASARARLAGQDGDLAVQPTPLNTDTALDQACRLLLQQRLTFLVPLDPLPFGQQLTAVDVRESTLVVQARGSGIVVRP